MRSKNMSDRPPKGVLVFGRPKDHDYSSQRMPERYDLFAPYFFENETGARWRALDSPLNTTPASLLSMKYGLKYVPVGSEGDCQHERIITILDEASAKSFEVLYFAESELFDVKRNPDDFYDIETVRASINDADGKIRDCMYEKFWKDNPDALD